MNPKEVVKQLIERDTTVNSVAELERKLGISNGTINKWDKSSPSPVTLSKVADYFDVSIDFLLGRSESNAPRMSDDLNKVLDEMKSFDGKPMTSQDREVIRAFLEGKFADK